MYCVCDRMAETNPARGCAPQREELKEAQAINKSLSALSNVFVALSKKNAHVPYRNSKLTFLLQVGSLPCLYFNIPCIATPTATPMSRYLLHTSLPCLYFNIPCIATPCIARCFVVLPHHSLYCHTLYCKVLVFQHSLYGPTLYCNTYCNILSKLTKKAGELAISSNRCCNRFKPSSSVQCCST